MRILRPLLIPLLLAPTLLAQDPVRVQTDVFDITFAAEGAAPTAWSVLPGADEPTKDEGALDLIDPDHVASSGLKPLALVLDATGPDRRAYSAEQTQRDGHTIATFTAAADASGLQVTKTYDFTPDSHLFSLEVAFTNTGSAQVTVGAEGGLGITLGPGLGYSQGARPELHNGRFLSPFVEPFVGTDGSAVSLALPTEEPFEVALPDGPLAFAGLQAPFTAVAIAMDSGALTGGVIRLPANGDEATSYPSMTLFSAPVTLSPGQSTSVRYNVFAGPKQRQLLTDTSLGLEAVLYNYLPGWAIPACYAMEVVVTAIHGVVGSWGLALVVFAILFRILMLPLSIWGALGAMQMKAKMAAVKPKVAELKKKYAKNSDKRNEAIIKLYKDEGINPMAQFRGCLPLLIQLPVLLALVQFLFNSYDLLGARFLWIGDLTRTDSLFPLGFELPWLGGAVNLLPLIMFAAMIVVGKMMATGDEKPTVGALLGLPIVMTLLFYPFPAGCLLFWVTGTVLQIPEQKIISAKTGG